ncbi:MAG TPA: alpha/beta hydrolase [Mycobacteriales bacterium]|nr:alpha/beta hydrolase [Mycobacteriales bacterium]
MATPARATAAGVAGLLCLIVVAPSAAQAADNTPQRTVTPAPPPEIVSSTGWYGPDSADTITLFEPAAQGRYPAVIFVHGGAWGRSQPNDSELKWAHDLAQDQGWLVAVIGYPAKVPHEQVVEPRAISYAVNAVAHRSDVDPQSLALWGESAGAQLALLTAYRDARTLDPLVSGVVSISGPTDMRTEYNSFAEIWLHAVTRFEGMAPQAAHDSGSRRYSLTSPVDVVSRRSPPTFQAISRLDPLVPPNQVKVLTQRLIQVGVMHRSVWLQGDGHSSTIEDETPPGSQYTVQQLAIAFLNRAFAQRRVLFG